MELAYRLAVEDTPLVAEHPRERHHADHAGARGRRPRALVDLARWRAATRRSALPPLVYWGHYVAHDNNRDARRPRARPDRATCSTPTSTGTRR